MAKGKIKLGLAQPLYRNEEAIKMMLYQITPVLTNWAHAQKEAQRQSNPKNAGRKPINPVLMFLILMVKEFLGLSNLRLAQISDCPCGVSTLNAMPITASILPNF